MTIRERRLIERIQYHMAGYFRYVILATVEPQLSDLLGTKPMPDK